MVDPDSVRTEYAYDELNHLETLTFGYGQQVTYEYFPDGLKKTVTNPNGHGVDLPLRRRRPDGHD